MTLVPPKFVDDFIKDQKQLIKDLSRSVTLGFPESVTVNCPNCYYDGASDSSTSIWTGLSGDITVFSGTSSEYTVVAKPFRQKCPVCGGTGALSIQRQTTIQAHVKWTNNKIATDSTYPVTPAGYEGQETVRIRADSRHYDDFVKATYFIVDGVTVKPASPPYIRSMKKADGIVQIVCKTSESGNKEVYR
jgi:hypothetical protein